MNIDSAAHNAKVARLRAGFDTHLKAARAIGCARTLVLGWENGTVALRGSRYLLKAASVYRVRPEWLADNDGPDGYPTGAASAEQDRVTAGERPPREDIQRAQDELRLAVTALARVLAVTIPTAGRALEIELAGLPQGRYLDILTTVVRRENAKLDVAVASAQAQKARGSKKRSRT